jgi:phospholipid/cholesterol/gamma-HCH transport system substrate-binding protein
VTAIRKHVRDFVAIIVLVVFAGAVAVYVLHHERLRFPLIESSPFHLNAEFSTAQAVTPGQGQTIRVSGVRIGDIASTSLHDGVATVSFDIDPQYKNLVHTDATALLRPKTGLKDGRSRSTTRCPTSTPTRSTRRSTATPATTSSC